MKPPKQITYIINNECWECSSHALNAEGYPTIARDNKCGAMYRYIYRTCVSEIPKGLVVRHICDNRKCINPSHLILGTHEDNVADRVKRGRSATGSNNGRSKLIPEQVLFIRNNLDVKISELAKKYSVDPKVISDIRNGKMWKTLL